MLKISTGKIAERIYLEGRNCTEAILIALRRVVDIPEEVVVCSSGFGAGVGGERCICGAIVGGVITIGAKFKRTEARKISGEFHKWFIKKFRSPCCKVITRNWKDNFWSDERREFCAGIVKAVADELERKFVDSS